MTDIQKIFLLSKANGADNCQDLLPANPIQWPTSWIQQRLEYLRAQEGKEQL